MRMLLRWIGSFFMTVAERCFELSEDHFPVVERAKGLEQRHTPLTIHQRGDLVEVTGCGKVVRFRR